MTTLVATAMKTLVDHLETGARAHPAKPAFVMADDTLDYAGLRMRVDALAGWMQRRHALRRGDRVLLLGPNHPRWVVAAYAVWRAGAVLVPVNPMSTADDFDYVAADSGARLALVDDSLSSRIAGCAAAVVAVSWQQAGAEALALNRRPQGDAVGLDDFCFLPYTSGTTGRPKGCMHTQATLLASLDGSIRWRGFTGDTVFFGNSPLFHLQGFQNGMNLAVRLGATAVMQARWNAREAAKLIERHRVSFWAAAPTMLVDLFADPQALAHDLSSLALVAGGGAALPEPVAAALQERLGLRYNEAYGMTETASFLHANPVGGGHRSCLGLATDGVDSRVVDAQSGAPLADGEIGELVTHAPQVMRRYWDAGLQPHANDGAFLEIDGKRFLRTGDLVQRDADGYFFLRDRLKRMINCAGFKVWPAEVEAVLHRHPDVQEACVIAIDDARRGESVKAFIVPKAGASLTEAGLIDWARASMASYKAPRRIEFRSALPRSATGKTAWRELQEQQRRADAALSAAARDALVASNPHTTSP